MATTIIPSSLTVTISESYVLNGVSYGNTINKIYPSNGEVSQRVMSIASKGESGTIFTNILALSTADGQGQVVKSDYRYFRITNSDTVSTLNMRIYNGSDYVAIEVKPSSSFLLMNAGIDSPINNTTAITFADITAIAGQSNSGTLDIDIEFLMVTA